MHLSKSLHRKFSIYLLQKLIQRVIKGKIRPFCVDQQGLWFKTKYGFSVYSNLKDRILELDVNPAWEEMESAFTLNNLKEADIFIDVGANIGYFSMLVAQCKAAKVLAIEPAPKTYEILNMNIKHNMLDRVIEPFNVALGSHKSTVKFVSSLGPKSHIGYRVNNIHAHLPTIEVKLTTLDEMLKDRQDIKKVDFIKVDIEGAEYDFLLGASHTIEKFRPMILMEIQEQRLIKYGANSEKVFTYINDLSYKYLFVTDNSIDEGRNYKEDLNKARDFIFYTDAHKPVY